MLSLQMGPEKARDWLMRCAEAREAWFGKGAWQEPLRPRVESLLGLPEGFEYSDLAAFCTDDTFACASLRHMHSVHAEWDSKTGREAAQAIEEWLSADPLGRLDGLDALNKALFTLAGKVSHLASLEKIDPQIAGVAARVKDSIKPVQDGKLLLELLEFIAPALSVGRRFALAWDEAKKRENLVDFDDLIRRAARLLQTEGLGEWIRYKLDRRFDHVLIDEAQDTNEAQWSIVDALTDDFFTGRGQHDDKLRTIFVVGDYKQAIFRFQGTSPAYFAAAKARYRELLAGRAANAAGLREGLDARELLDLGLGRSYRTAQDILTFVDDAIGAIGYPNLGLGEDERKDPHKGDTDRPGLVTLWEPIRARSDDEDERDPEDGETWISAPEREMANAIAEQVKQWMDRGFPLVKGEKRNATPGDVMVLVRKRRELAGLIVARLHAAGVPVAGVDRLRLGAPLAVKDLMAAMRFAAQPLDDLSLACLLVSPIFGWSQQDLLDHGFRPEGRHLWDHLRKSSHPLVVETLEMLGDLLARADFEPPQSLLHWMLVGPWQARRKLTGRLGSEANDPIDELLNAALAFAASNTPSLQGFIQWFDAGEGEVKREAEASGNQVRVLTVHGSKGLQSPIVILADATGNPDRSLPGGLELEEYPELGEGRKLPIPNLSKDKRTGPIAAAAEAAEREDREEHWRLLYVAMTRAEEALFIGGALGKSEKEPAKHSWYARLAPLFAGDALSDPIWNGRWERGEKPAPAFPQDRQVESALDGLPHWARVPLGKEPRPPRPLAPSSAADDQGADPPLPVEQAAIAARRGVLIHALLERLPDIPADDRAEQGRLWLSRRAADLAEAERDDMLQKAMQVLAAPEWRELFSPAALAEVPLAATVEGQVIAGTVDRLLVERGRVVVVDFKTARRPPASIDEVPPSTLKQMGAYAAALEAIFPGRRAEAVVLYTQTPHLIAIPEAVLAANKPRFVDKQ